MLEPIITNPNDIVLEEGVRDVFRSNSQQELKSRASIRKETEVVAVSKPKAQRIGSNIDALRAKLAAMSAEEKANRF